MFDRKVLIGIGIGMIIATTIMCVSRKNVDYSKTVIEKKARSMGMEYPGEMRVIDKVHENK